jgi:hypothetical protein
MALSKTIAIYNKGSIQYLRQLEEGENKKVLHLEKLVTSLPENYGRLPNYVHYKTRQI